MSQCPVCGRTSPAHLAIGHPPPARGFRVSFVLPEFAKKFIVDFIETGLAVIFALNIAQPATLDDVKAIALTIGGALAGAAIAAGRRAAPGFIAYVKEKLGQS